MLFQGLWLTLCNLCIAAVATKQIAQLRKYLQSLVKKEKDGAVLTSDSSYRPLESFDCELHCRTLIRHLRETIQ